ncbi:regucalcin [Amyelois transitella]|uniref:regucalcin n=1 Tax=Amyelois transitella TaxID=680683 RepID=UPI00298F535A|nr:regucalcin [Amyelois transitella]
MSYKKKIVVKSDSKNNVLIATTLTYNRNFFQKYPSILSRIRSHRRQESNKPIEVIPSVNYATFSYTNVTYKHATSPVCDPDLNLLYWVDALNQNVHALDWNTGKQIKRHIDYGEVNFIVPIQNSNRVLLGVKSELYLLDWEVEGSAGLRLVTLVDQGQPDNTLNEGKADALGRLWAGTKGAQSGNMVVPDNGALYKFEQPDFFPHVVLKPVSISNALAWSLNNSVLYYIDSATKKIEAFDFDLERGHISKRRTIFDITEYGYEKATPDGMTIDKDGMLWVALMFGGSVIRVDPNAKRIIELYELPVTGVSSVGWAGPDLDQLIVTTSRRNMDQEFSSHEPLAGSLFILTNTGTAGVPSFKVAFENADEYR